MAMKLSSGSARPLQLLEPGLYHTISAPQVPWRVWGQMMGVPRPCPCPTVDMSNKPVCPWKTLSPHGHTGWWQPWKPVSPAHQCGVSGRDVESFRDRDIWTLFFGPGIPRTSGPCAGRLYRVLSLQPGSHGRSHKGCCMARPGGTG